jgi:hypothetical protein
VQYNAGTSFEEAKREIGRDHLKKKTFARYDNLWKGRESTYIRPCRTHYKDWNAQVEGRDSQVYEAPVPEADAGCAHSGGEELASVEVHRPKSGRHAKFALIKIGNRRK